MTTEKTSVRIVCSTFGSQCMIHERRVCAIRDSDEFEKMLEESGLLKTDFPSIEFASQTLLMAFYGECSNGSNALKLLNPMTDGEGLHVEVVDSVPTDPKGAPGLTMVTSPYYGIIVQYSGEVSFIEVNMETESDRKKREVGY